MNKIKADIKTVFQVLSFMALFFLISMLDHPIFAAIAGVFWLFAWSFNIYDKVKYRNNKYQNEIRFPTQNDLYFKVTSITLGLIITIGCVIWLILSKENFLVQVVGLLSGIMILINGIIDVPKGELIIQNSKIKLSGVLAEIKLHNTEAINIDTNQITIFKVNGNKVQLNKLELNHTWISRITDFLRLKLRGTEINITCTDSE